MGSSNSDTSGAQASAGRFDEPLASGVRWWLEDRVLVLRNGVRFTTEDLAQALAEAAQTTVFDGPLPLMWDNRLSAELTSSQEIRARADRFAELHAQFGPRIAMVVADAVHYGLARMGGSFVEFAGGFELEVFDTPAEAMAWLCEGRSSSHAGHEEAQTRR